MLALATWFLWLVAVAMFLAIGSVGYSFLRGMSRGQPRERIEAHPKWYNYLFSPDAPLDAGRGGGPTMATAAERRA